MRSWTRKDEVPQGNIVTLGLSPAWDITCVGRGLDWGQHVTIEHQSIQPAGKALNVSRALNWLGQRCIATGLWGREDIGRLRRALGQTTLIEPDLMGVPGRTRVSVTVVDSARSRDMHLRCPSSLASQQSLRALTTRLKRRLQDRDLCILSGALPRADLEQSLLTLCHAVVRKTGGGIVLDSHGPLYQAVVKARLAWLISPNTQELERLLNRSLRNSAPVLAKAATEVLEDVPMILISRGHRGALLVTRDGVWQGHCRVRGKPLSTVGCGDYLLAGFVAALQRRLSPRAALAQGLKVATARAWGWTERRTWPAARREIPVDTKSL